MQGSPALPMWNELMTWEWEVGRENTASIQMMTLTLLPMNCSKEANFHFDSQKIVTTNFCHLQWKKSTSIWGVPSKCTDCEPGWELGWPWLPKALPNIWSSFPLPQLISNEITYCRSLSLAKLISSSCPGLRMNLGNIYLCLENPLESSTKPTNVEIYSYILQHTPLR